MPVIEISSLEHPGVEIFCTLTEAQLRRQTESGKGLFIAESPNVISRALDAGYEPIALLCERKHITGDAAKVIERCGDVPVYTGDRELLATLTGYVLTRGVLCAMYRPVFRSDTLGMDGWTIRDLRWLGFRTAAMALTENSISIDHPSLAAEPRLAIVMGTEGEGLSQETIVEADYVVRIPMAHGVDSLNVAAAAAVAFWQLRAPETTEN